MDEHLTKRGIIGGVSTVILANITTGEFMKTALLAAVGSAVSVLMSMLIKRITKSLPGNSSPKKEE